MTPVSLVRRCLAGVAGVVVGVGLLFAANPAQAQTRPAEATFTDTCDGVKITLHSASLERHSYAWTVTADDAVVFEVSQSANEKLDPPFLAEGARDIHVLLERSGVNGYHRYSWEHSWQSPGGCAPAEQKQPEKEDAPGDTEKSETETSESTPERAGPMGETEPSPDGTRPGQARQTPGADAAGFALVPFVGCDLLVVGLRNDDQEDVALTLRLLPDRDTSQGAAPAYLPLLEPASEAGADLREVEAEAEGLASPEPIGGAETIEIGPVEPGTAHAHGFATVDGLVVTAEVVATIEDEPTVLEMVEVVGEPQARDCTGVETGAGGGVEQPEPAPRPLFSLVHLLIGAGSVVSLILSGALFLLDRRRRRRRAVEEQTEVVSDQPAAG